jgi:MYXO-CTERM domain-containing protein
MRIRICNHETRTARTWALALLLPIVALTGGVAQAAIITNGDLETAVGNLPDLAGNSHYLLDGSNNVIATNTQAPLGQYDGDTGLNANEWVRTRLSRGFVWSASGGNGGTGGFVSTGSNDKNAKPRAVALFVDDAKATTGVVSVSIDVKLSQAAQFLTVELWGWDNGQAGPELSLGGPDANDPAYFVTTPNAATSLLDATADTATLNTWTTVSLADVDLGTGHDHYAWRVGIVSATTNGFAFDNLVAVPEPASLAMGLAGFALIAARRRR